MSVKEDLKSLLADEPSRSNAPTVEASTPSQCKLFNWIEKHRAQIWFDRHTNNWVCQVIYHPHVIQPARKTLLAAIVDCKSEFESKQIS